MIINFLLLMLVCSHWSILIEFCFFGMSRTRLPSTIGSWNLSLTYSMIERLMSYQVLSHSNLQQFCGFQPAAAAKKLCARCAGGYLVACHFSLSAFTAGWQRCLQHNKKESRVSVSPWQYIAYHSKSYAVPSHGGRCYKVP